MKVKGKTHTIFFFNARSTPHAVKESKTFYRTMAQMMQVKSNKPASPAQMIRKMEVEDAPELPRSVVDKLVVVVEVYAKDSVVVGASSTRCCASEATSGFPPSTSPLEVRNVDISSPARVDVVKYCCRVMSSETSGAALSGLLKSGW